MLTSPWKVIFREEIWKLAGQQSAPLLKLSREISETLVSFCEIRRLVNVPCTSSATCRYAAQMSGSVVSLYKWRGGVGWGGVGWGTHVNVPCTSSATCCYAAKCYLPKNGPRNKDFVWVGSPQARWVWKKHSTVEWRKSVATLEQSMPHGVLSKTSSLTRCVQRLHGVLAVEICESAYPSPAKSNFNFEAPALKRKKERQKERKK